jgi:hypothetical protein
MTNIFLRAFMYWSIVTCDKDSSLFFKSLNIVTVFASLDLKFTTFLNGLLRDEGQKKRYEKGFPCNSRGHEISSRFLHAPIRDTLDPGAQD